MRIALRAFLLLVSTTFLAFSVRNTARAAGPAVPAEAAQAMETMYAGDFEGAIEMLRHFERAQPESPLGYLLEGEAEWWKMYCAACDIKWGMLDVWKRGKMSQDEAYLALADNAITLGQAQLAKSDSAEMHLYVGIGWALKARLYSLRGENRNTARAGVAARAQFIRAVQIDPQMADATAGLGLYDYYVDTLSPIVKLLRFIVGIPAGNKREGIREMETGINQGTLMAVETRFYLAKNLRNYDLQYERAAKLMELLVASYPRNPTFLLLLGNLNAELHRYDKASEYFHAALSLPNADPACAARTRAIAQSFFSTPH
jgi:tetratricopeptide (TPR) repeat protein